MIKEGTATFDTVKGISVNNDGIVHIAGITNGDLD